MARSDERPPVGRPDRPAPDAARRRRRGPDAPGRSAERPARHADAAGLDAVGADATVFVDDRVAAFAADERAATVLDAAEAATLLDPNARGRRAPATGDATVAPGSRPPSSSDAGTAATVPPPGVRYVREAVAGQGGMGTVHVARDLELLRRVALKELSFEVAHDRSARSRFVREVQVTAQLDHPHIVPVYGLEVASGGRPAYAMKLVEGQTFGQLIADTRAFCDADGAQELALSAPIVGDSGRRLGAPHIMAFDTIQPLKWTLVTIAETSAVVGEP